MRLSTNFTLEDFERSETARRNNLDNTAPSAAIERLQYLVDQCLQPMRTHFGEPIFVNSGYRSKLVNDAVGSGDYSHHRWGQAADIRFNSSSETGNTLMDIIEYAYANLDYTELILENPKAGGWVHIAIQEGRERERQLKLKKIGDKVRRASIEEIREYWKSIYG